MAGILSEGTKPEPRQVIHSTIARSFDEGHVKTVQSLLRHANPSITMGIYTHAVSSKKREAQSRVLEMVLPERKAAMLAVAGGTA